MSIIEQVLTIPEEKLEEYVLHRIDYLEKENQEGIVNLGFLVEENYKKDFLLSDRDYVRGFRNHFLYDRYIPKGSKIIYGYESDGKYNYRNCGYYYYMDTDDYILNFCQYIRKKKVGNFEDFLGNIYDFLQIYFGEIKKIDRDEVFKVIMDSDGSFFVPNLEHGLSWLKNNGSAECSEYSSVLHNILNFFDVDSILVFGRIKIDEQTLGHSYNLVVSTDDDDIMLVDFSKNIKIMDINYNVVETAPFIGRIDGFSEDLYNDLIEDKSKIVFDDYDYMIIGNNLGRIRYSSKRDYHFVISNSSNMSFGKK